MDVKEAAVEYLIEAAPQTSGDDVQPGYKRTEVGVIPEDWKASTVGAEFTIQLGKMLDSEKNAGVSKPFLGNRSVQWGRVDVNDLSEIRLTPADLQRYRLRVGDLLVCEGGEIGRAAIWQGELDECYYQKALHRLRTKRGYNPALLMNVLAVQTGAGFLQNFVTQTSIPHLPKDKFEIVPIPRPAEAEQDAIAEALSDADALIAALQRLIAKKRAIKQGTMQALLTGRQRLPGFTGEWENRPMSELFTFSGGMNASREQLSSKGHCYLHYGDIHTSTKTIVDVGTSFADIPKLDVPLNKVSRGSLLNTGDVVFVDASEDEDGASKHMVVENPDGCPFISGLHTIVAKPKNDALVPSYCRYCFQTRSVKSQFRFFAVGTKVLGVSKGNIGKIEVLVPSRDEQTAIATVLSDMDAEIEALEARLTKTRQLKAGMMQQLLTGRIRLPLEAAA